MPPLDRQALISALATVFDRGGQIGADTFVRANLLFVIVAGRLTFAFLTRRCCAVDLRGAGVVALSAVIGVCLEIDAGVATRLEFVVALVDTVGVFAVLRLTARLVTAPAVLRARQIDTFPTAKRLVFSTTAFSERTRLVGGAVVATTPTVRFVGVGVDAFPVADLLVHRTVVDANSVVALPRVSAGVVTPTTVVRVGVGIDAFPVTFELLVLTALLVVPSGVCIDDDGSIIGVVAASDGQDSAQAENRTHE